MNKKIVGHYKLTNMAWAPDAIVQCINKYSDKYKAILIDPNFTDCYKDIPIVRKIENINCDILHFHNKYENTSIPNLIQYHSPPYDCYVDFSFSGFKTVIAQYHATLPEYKNCKIVRNIIDINHPMYNYKKIDKIKIGFSPSCKFSRGNRGFESKGHIETKEILECISKNLNVEIDVLHEVPIEKCIQRKSECSILIDECVTNSYHRNSLEGLVLGKFTICSLGDDVIKILKNISKSDIVPLENVWIEQLEAKLIKIIGKGVNYINEIGEKNRKWMEQYWNPKTIVNEFEDIYDKILEEHNK